MADIRVQVEGLGVVQFPEGTPPEAIKAAIAKKLGPQPQSPLRNFAEGLGSGVASIADFAAQAAPHVLPFLPKGAGKAETDVVGALEQRGVAPDEGSFAGKVGEFAGASAVPGLGQLKKVQSATTLGKTVIKGLLSNIAAAGGTEVAEAVAPGSAVAQVAGAIAPSALAKTGAGVVRGALRGTDSRASQAAVEQFARQGATPSVGQAGTGGIARTLEAGLGSVPGGGQALHAHGKRANAALERRLQRISGGEVSEFEAGTALKQGVEEFAGKFRQASRKLYARVDALIDPESVAPLRHTSAKLNELADTSEVAKLFGTPKLAALGEKLAEAGGKLEYRDLTALRSRIGSRLTSNELMTGVDRKDLKALYRALSDDARDAAEAAGPGALQAFNTATKHYRAGIKRVDDFLEGINKQVTPEQAYKWVSSGNPVDSSKLFAVKRSLSEAQWRTVQRATLTRMGRATAGRATEDAAFSTQTFLTNWNKLTPRAKAALFGKNTVMRRDLDDLASTADKIRQGAQVLANPSGTAGTGLMAATIFSGLGAGVTLATGGAAAPAALAGLATLAGASASAYTLSRLMTNPKFVRWAARGTRVSAEEAGAHIARLVTIAEDSSLEDREAILEFAEALGAE